MIKMDLILNNMDDNKILSLYSFKHIIRNVIYIKYNDGYVDKCEYIKELIDYKNKTHNDLMSSNYLLTNNSSKWHLSQLASEVDKKFDDYASELYKKLYYISEIKFFSSDSSSETQTIHIEKGRLHNLSGPAHTISSLNLYFINGERLPYDKWKSHPIIRYNKLSKLIGKIKP